jgi:hypothetical protein
VKENLVYEGGNLAAVGVRLPTFSVNRGGEYSQPEDVLIPPLNKPIENIELMGIVSLLVGHIPPQLTPTGGKTIEFKIEHAPEEDNYSHCNVKAYKDGGHTEKLQISETIKKEFRAEIARQAFIVRAPQI